LKNSENLFDEEQKFLLQTYKRIPLEISHGEGVYLFTKDGKKYLDFFSGLGVNALGYGNKKIIQAINDQVKKFIHLSNYYVNQPQIELAKRLVKYSGLSKVFFTNSGTEAVEAALKLIRKTLGPGKKIISFTNSFHGRTYGSLSLTSKEKYKKAFRPLLPNISQLEFNNVEMLKTKINENIAAVFIEFIQGEGGINVASIEFIEALKSLQNKFGFILVADEIQSGTGRTGKPFAYNHYNINPDLVVLAKSIGGGLPLGALITSEKYSSIFENGDHGSTFGGNPVACSAGIVVLDEVFENGLMNRISELGNYFKNELTNLKSKYSNLIKDIRGMGFMLGIELPEPCYKVIQLFREKGIFINCTNEKVLRILPPLTSSKENINYFLTTFGEILSESKK
jgi:predicted acetylornithine/succinylornithine family transaminase